MPFLELFDETLDINSTENYELSVQVSPDNISFCLLDSIRRKFILIRSFEAELNKLYDTDKIKEILSGDDFLIRKYKKTSIVMPSKKFTLVPASLFDPAKKEEYFRFNHNKDEKEIIITNKINDPDIYLISAVSKPVYEILNFFFPDNNPVHHIKPLFNHISHIRKSISGNYIHVHIERDFFNLIIFHSSDLKFCNTFCYRNVSDILYYVLNVFKTLNIKHEETIYFSGLTEKYDDISSGFSMYVRNLKFSEISGNCTFSYVFNATNLHRYINLFSLTTCE
jgi:hypothetical protein